MNQLDESTIAILEMNGFPHPERLCDDTILILMEDIKGGKGKLQYCPPWITTNKVPFSPDGNGANCFCG